MNAFELLLSNIGKIQAKTLSLKLFVLTMVLLGASCAGPNVARMEDDPNQVCLLLKLTGTNIPKKQCKTKEAWEALAKEDREVSDEYFRQTSQASSARGNASPDAF